MEPYVDGITIMRLYNHAGLSSVCGVVTFRGQKRLFSLRWTGLEHDVPNSWTLRGIPFPNLPCFPTYRDGLAYIERFIG